MSMKKIVTSATIFLLYTTLFTTNVYLFGSERTMVEFEESAADLQLTAVKSCLFQSASPTLDGKCEVIKRKNGVVYVYSADQMTGKCNKDSKRAVGTEKRKIMYKGFDCENLGITKEKLESFSGTKGEFLYAQRDENIKTRAYLYFKFTNPFSNKNVEIVTVDVI